MHPFLSKTLMVTGLCFCSLSAQSAVITGLFATGVDATGNPLVAGQGDTHYTVNENADSFGQLYYNPAYISNSANSQWIWQTNNGQPGNTVRTFKTSFDLAGFNAATVQIDGLWGADNQGLDILLNGVSTGINLLGTPVSNFTSLHAYSITSGFINGINTLEYIIEDNGAPGAFRNEFTSATASVVPVPAAAWLFGSGLIGLVGLVRRKA